ncbi:Exodeoxyribonuclease V beta chain (fragment) [Mesorhizobium prunaredense]|uniref:Exodeoxyribonuclease V beta chain n=1 Tax=Mesorhizobium prunaredense TaxID=1631249 RepID=A0A1R3V8F3_9HYPH
MQVVELIRELAFLRRKHPGATPIAPPQDGRPDTVFVQSVDDFDRWQAGLDDQRWLPQVSAELQRLAARYKNTFERPADFATLWKLCEASQSRLFTKKGLQLRPYAEVAESFGAYREETASDAELHHYQAVSGAWEQLIGHIASRLVCELSSSLDQLLDSYQRRKRAAAVLDFDDLLLHVRTLVRDHEEVRRAIGHRYKYLLVDEFQDTDRLQIEILFSIGATSDRAQHWQDSRLRPGSLFLVGDPKQAIYRFRGADIEAYELSRRLVLAQEWGDVIEVTANFRSQQPIIRHVNNCFEVVFTKGSQPRYVALAPTLPDTPIRCPASRGSQSMSKPRGGSMRRCFARQRQSALPISVRV